MKTEAHGRARAMTNLELLRGLHAAGKIRCALPEAMGDLALPLGSRPSRDRIEGMLLGLAIGDSLGDACESLAPPERRARLGEVRGYLPRPESGMRAIGLPSDDTQLSFWTLESILEKGEVDCADIARRFAEGHIHGIGNAVRGFLRNMQAGKPWHEAGLEQAGNGALMRVAPLVLPELQAGGETLLADLVLGSMITHNDSTSIASCLGFGLMLRELLAAEAAPEPEWWHRRFVELASPFEAPGAVYRPRGGERSEYSGGICGYVSLLVPEALGRGLSALEACESWYSGAYLLETVPSLLYILARHSGDPEEAIVRAVNDSKDNDSIASMAGAAMGALHGASGLPRRWREALSGRTRETDDGRVQALARLAGERYGSGGI